MLIFTGLYSFQARKPPGGVGIFPATIIEDNEPAADSHYPVARTLTQTDPEGKMERDV